MITLSHTGQNQEFVESVNFDVVSVIFDPNADIISRNNMVTLSVEDFDMADNIQISPNPVTDYLTIIKPEFAEIFGYTIYNSIGQKVIVSNRFSNIIDLENLGTGFYVIQFQLVDRVINKTLLKK